MDITLGCILSPTEPETMVRKWFARNARHFKHVIVCVDSDAGEETARRMERFVKSLPHPDMSVFLRPLARDFAAQRNAVMERVRTDWLLMLDADEYVADKYLRILTSVLRKVLKDRPAMRVLGLARKNMVDGERTEDWPDWQFRLVRRGTRWRNTDPHKDASPGCHEFPRELFDEPEVVVGLEALVIEHHKTEERQQRQNAFYEAITTDEKPS